MALLPNVAFPEIRTACGDNPFPHLAGLIPAP